MTLTLERPAEYLISLVRELCGLNRETEWVEFKVNVRKPEEVGEVWSVAADSPDQLSSPDTSHVFSIICNASVYLTVI